MLCCVGPAALRWREDLGVALRISLPGSHPPPRLLPGLLACCSSLLLGWRRAQTSSSATQTLRCSLRQLQQLSASSAPR